MSDTGGWTQTVDLAAGAEVDLVAGASVAIDGQPIDVAVTSGTLTATPDTDLDGVVAADAKSFLVRPEPMGLAISRSLHSNITRITKWGKNFSVGTTFEPVAMSGTYAMPLSSAATTVRVKAGNAADTAAGAGARSVTVEGVDATGAKITETLTTNGAAAGPNSTNSFMRVYRAYVASSGSYATPTTASHVGNITIEDSAGTFDFITIDATDYGRGQSETAFYVVPTGKIAYVGHINLNVEPNNDGTFIFFIRENILETAAPFSPLRSFLTFEEVSGTRIWKPDMPIGPITGPADVGFYCRAAATAGDVDALFEIYELDP